MSWNDLGRNGAGTIIETECRARLLPCRVSGGVFRRNPVRGAGAGSMKG